MPFSFEITCSKCSFSGELLWPMWVGYQWDCGRTIEIGKEVCWCRTCRTVTTSEKLTDLSVLELLQQIPAIKCIGDKMKAGWTQTEKEKILEYTRSFTNLHDNLVGWEKWNERHSVVLFETLKLHQAWRKERRTPPRCLTCGGFQFNTLPLYLEAQEEQTLHPDCEGVLTFTRKRKVRPQRLLWTPEGEFIGKG